MGPGGTKDPEVDTCIGNKKHTANTLDDEIALRQCCQILPIIQYPSHIVRDTNGNEWLQRLHRDVQKVLDQFFNSNEPTATMMQEVVTNQLQEQKQQSTISDSTHTTAPLLKPPVPRRRVGIGCTKFKEGEEVIYRKGQLVATATILRVHFDDELDPFYTISVAGSEKQTDEKHLCKILCRIKPSA